MIDWIKENMVVSIVVGILLILAGIGIVSSFRPSQQTKIEETAQVGDKDTASFNTSQDDFIQIFVAFDNLISNTRNRSFDGQFVYNFFCLHDKPPKRKVSLNKET